MSLEGIEPKKCTVGAKETIKALRRGDISQVFVGSDCEQKVIAPIISLCQELEVPCEREYTMKELGKAVHIKVRAAAIGTLK